jgi:hypothetical protein
MSKKDFVEHAAISITAAYVASTRPIVTRNALAEWSIDVARELWMQLDRGDVSQEGSVPTVVGSCTYCKHVGSLSSCEPCISCYMKAPSNWEHHLTDEDDESE